jgi:hypothetical protein
MTAAWETELEEIAQGSKPRERFLDNVRRQVREYVGLIRNGHREVVAVTGIAEGSTAKPLTFGGITLCDRGAFFESEHFPGVRFYKELCGRRMKAQEIASVLGANGLYFNEAAQRLEFDFSR